MPTRRSVLALACTAALLPLAQVASAQGVQTYEAAKFAAAQASGQPILIEIHAVWCGTCKIQKAVIGDLVMQGDLATLNIFRVDFDDQKDAVAAFGADMQSTLIVFKGKSEVGRTVGETSGKAIESLLRLAI